MRLNEVRPRRPEQFYPTPTSEPVPYVSMKSGLEGRNNLENQAKLIQLEGSQ